MMYYQQNEKCNEEEEELCFYNSKKKRKRILHWSSSSIPNLKIFYRALKIQSVMFYCAVLRNLFLNQVFEAKRKICVWYANNFYEVCEINFEKRTINPRKTLMLWKNYFWAARVACFTYDYAMESRDENKLNTIMFLLKIIMPSPFPKKSNFDFS